MRKSADLILHLTWPESDRLISACPVCVDFVETVGQCYRDWPFSGVSCPIQPPSIARTCCVLADRVAGVSFLLTSEVKWS